MVKDESDITVELPTLTNVIKTGFREIRSSTLVVKKQVLKNVSGVFKPGTITLVLGQPGSGKSSLMKLLSGRFLCSGQQASQPAIHSKVNSGNPTTSDLEIALPPTARAV
ncbi:ABC transporter G family member 31 [Phytophthora nicotianae]|uniref:ABC transporter G family member 31 n=1 Tax=Phytophthora nicotianae TaxID=4792 RepID=A0A0W8DWX8_PHYNI|nr:ABC transporter G family member 31 [Phytophthora nicotianae]